MSIVTRGTRTGNRHGVANGLDKGRVNVVADVVNKPAVAATPKETGSDNQKRLEETTERYWKRCLKET